MVIKTETTTIVTTPKLQAQVQPSLKRWLRHCFYLPMSKRYFNKSDQVAIAAAVHQAEQGHIGEIQVVIEGAMPSRLAYDTDTRLRAEQLFAELGVWDTAHNSGVLLYLNLCEQKVEIVIDRGIQQLTEQAAWDQLCIDLLQGLKNKNYRAAVCIAVAEIGIIFNRFDQHPQIVKINERPDLPIILS